MGILFYLCPNPFVTYFSATTCYSHFIFCYNLYIGVPCLGIWFWLTTTSCLKTLTFNWHYSIVGGVGVSLLSGHWLAYVLMFFYFNQDFTRRPCTNGKDHSCSSCQNLVKTWVVYKYISVNVKHILFLDSTRRSCTYGTEYCCSWCIQDSIDVLGDDTSRCHTVPDF